MADVRKTVEIALKVVGVNLTQINKVSASLEKVSKSIEKTTTYVDKLKKSFDSLETTKITQIATSLKQISNIKSPNLANIANGFEKLSKMAKPPDISPFVKELQKFQNIKLPNLTTMVSGFQKMISLDIKGVVSKIKSLNTALANLDKRGGISAFKNFANDINKLKSSVASASNSTKRMTDELGKVGSAAQSAGFKIRTFGDKIQTVFQFRLISEGIMQLRDAVTAGVAAIIDYDQALKDLQAITGATSLEVAQMGATILEVASTTKFSAAEVAAGMRTIGQAGFSASEAVETMQAVSDLATGTLSDMAATVDLVTTAMRVFQIDATESAMVADVFANAVNRSKLTIDKLRTAMNYIGPIARDSGVSFKELSASMMTLANSGLRASTIGTGLRRVFAELIDPSKKLAAAADRAGVSLNELDPRASSLKEVIGNLSLVINDAQLAFDVFGKRGASAVLALSGSGTQFNEMLEMVDRSGTAALQASIQMEGLGVSFKNLRDKLGNLAIMLGKAGIADAFKVFVDVAREVVDVLIYLSDTVIGKFILKLVGLAAVIGTVTAAFLFLRKTMVFTGMINGFAALTTAALAFQGSMAGLLLTVAPLVAIFAALVVGAAYFFDSLGAAKRASDEAAILAGSYDTLLKKQENYNKTAATTATTSGTMLAANKSLREELLKTATEFKDVAEEARLAALSIDPLTGTINEGSDAIEKYNEKLRETSELKLVDSANLANKAYKDEILNVWTLIDAYGFHGAEMEKNIDSYAELKEEVKKLIGTNDELNKSQKKIVSQYDYISEVSGRIFTSMLKWGTVDVDQTVEGFTEMAEKAGYAGIILEGMIDQFNTFKKANEGNFSNIIEKWAQEGEDALVSFQGEYEKLGGTFAAGEQAALNSIAIEKESLAFRLQAEKDKQKAAAASGVEIGLTWKRYFVAERALLEEAGDLRQRISENEHAQKIKLIEREADLYKTATTKVLVTTLEGSKNRHKQLEDAEREHIANVAKIMGDAVIDPADQEKVYKANLTERETLFAKHLDSIAALESKGILTSAQAEGQKLRSTVDFYKESYREAVKYRNLINEKESPELFQERQAVVLQAEEAYYKSRTKFLYNYNSEVTKANKEIVKLEEKVTLEKEKNLDEQEKDKKKAVDKLVALEEDYADKIIAIDEALKDKVTEIDTKIADNRKSALNDVLSLESSTEEKIRQIRRKGLTDVEAQESDRNAANEYLREGRLLLAQADKQKDEEKLARGIELIQQAESIGGSLDDERKAVNFLKSTLESLKDARNIEAEIAELELLKQKEEEIAEAAAESAALKEAYDEKVLNATTAIEAIELEEEDRHTKEMANLNAEIEKWKEKAFVARGALTEEGADTGIQGITDAIQAEEERHTKELTNIDSETSAIVDKYQAARQELEDYGLSQEELDMNFDDFFSTLTGAADEAHQEVKDIMEEDIVIHTDNEELEETQELLDEVDNTILDVLAEVIGKDNVDALWNAINRLKDKIVTVTTKFVTQGQPEGKATGGRMPGYGGGDRNHILTEDGEWVIRKEAVRKFGDSFMNSINNMSLPKFQTGGKVGIPTSTGDTSSGGTSETLVVRFQAGGVEAPVSITDPSSRSAMKQMANELTKMRLTYAR